MTWKRIVKSIAFTVILCIGVILLANIKSAQSPKPYSVTRFLGLNTANELQAKAGESPDMCNFRVTEDYRLQKREGIDAFNIDFSSVFTPTELESFSMTQTWYGQLKTDGKKYLYCCGTYNYKPAPEADIETFIAMKVDMDTKAVVKAFSTQHEYPSPNASMFYRNGYLYCMTGLSYEKIDGTNYETVEGTIPTLYLNVKPNLSDRGEKMYQPINILSNNVDVNYYADGTNSYWFAPVKDILMVSSVHVNGTYSTKWTPDYLNYTVSFSSGYIPNAGDTVVIRYVIFTGSSNIASEIAMCKHSIHYGGAQDADTFVWGYDYYKNRMYYTYGGDPEFFAATNYITFGTSDDGITGAVVQNNALAVFTERGIYSLRAVVDVESESLVTTVTYPVTYIKADRGHAYPNCKIQSIRNNPFFIGKDNSVWALVVSTYRDDRAAKYISSRIQEETAKLDLDKGFTIDWEANGEYWLVSEQTAIIYNYRNDTWYKFMFSTSFNGGLIIDDNLLLFSDLDAYLFNKDSKNDSGECINAYWTSPYMDYGTPYLKKSIRSIYTIIAAYENTDSYIRLEYNTSEEETPEIAEFELFAGEPPKPLYSSISAVGFKHIKYKFVSDKLDATGMIIGFTTPVVYNGYVR